MASLGDQPQKVEGGDIAGTSSSTSAATAATAPVIVAVDAESVQVSEKEQDLIVEKVIAVLSSPAAAETSTENSSTPGEESEGEAEGGDEQGEGEEKVATSDDTRKRVEEEGVRARTAQVSAVRGDVERLWRGTSGSGSQNLHFETVTKTLADGCREVKWRLPLGEAGILDFYLVILRAEAQTQRLSTALKIQILRLIGNSSADTSQNRARVVESGSFKALISLVRDVKLLPFTIHVLYNICVEYEPAQKQASRDDLTKELINLLSGPGSSAALDNITHIAKLLDFMAAQEADVQSAPSTTVTTLLPLATSTELDLDLEDFTSVVTTSINYLTYERFQEALLATDALPTLLTVLSQSYTRFPTESLDEDDIKSISQMRLALTQVLSDISALPSFTSKVLYPSSPVAETLCQWLSSPHQHLQVNACITLGNIARSDDVCVKLVEVQKVHIPLIAIISSANESQLLHASLGFLKNLSLPELNKKALAKAGLVDCLPRLWEMDVLQQVQFSAVSLARQVVVGMVENVLRRYGAKADKDGEPTVEEGSDDLHISIVTGLFERTDIEPVKMETSRLITAIFRVLYAVTDPAEYGLTTEQLIAFRKNLYKQHPDVVKLLTFMITQSKWPVVRSEAWFVFALMTRSADGAAIIFTVLQDKAVAPVLVDLFAGQRVEEDQTAPSISKEKSEDESKEEDLGIPSELAHLTASQPPKAPQQSAQSKRADTMNVVVLLAELLEQVGKDVFDGEKRAELEALLATGGKTVAGYSEVEKYGDDGLGSFGR